MLHLLAFNGLIYLTYHVAAFSNMVCEETADQEVTDKFSVKSVLYGGVHMCGGIWARGVLLPHVFARECHLMIHGLPWWIGERWWLRYCGNP